MGAPRGSAPWAGPMARQTDGSPGGRGPSCRGSAACSHLATDARPPPPPPPLSLLPPEGPGSNCRLYTACSCHAPDKLYIRARDTPFTFVHGRVYMLKYRRYERTFCHYAMYFSTIGHILHSDIQRRKCNYCFKIALTLKYSDSRYLCTYIRINKGPV